MYDFCERSKGMKTRWSFGMDSMIRRIFFMVLSIAAVVGWHDYSHSRLLTASIFLWNGWMLGLNWDRGRSRISANHRRQWRQMV